MPLYNYKCSADALHLYEQFESLKAHEQDKLDGFRCKLCGAPASQVPAVAASAFRTMNGNLYRFTGTQGGAHGTGRLHRGKTATIGKGHGMGGRGGNPKLGTPVKGDA